MRPGTSACHVQAPHSLRDSDFQKVEAMLAAIGGTWLVEQHDDYDGDLSLLLTELSNGTAGPSFHLHRTAAGFHVADTGWESFRPIGTFGALSSALLRVRRHVRSPAEAG